MNPTPSPQRIASLCRKRDQVTVFGAPFPPHLRRRVTRFLDFTFLRDYFLIVGNFMGHHKKSWKIMKSRGGGGEGGIITREGILKM